MTDSSDHRPSAELADFSAGLPKAELHVHQIGSASPVIVTELAARHPEAGVPSNLADLTEYFRYRLRRLRPRLPLRGGSDQDRR